PAAPPPARQPPPPALAGHTAGGTASRASPGGGEAPAACVFGAIPPFSFHPALRLVADPLLFERFPQIAFNAGRLDRSIILDTEDYLHIARPEIATFRRLS
ncbi:YbaK/prolyl-tRNA synthetase associated domain-containing protein, partial [Klebsiella pneumoniae]|nr:YbaK/prolyl-tRNA synthetase associated domain-containing protein [Klebsiella pneumoniae]